MKKKRYFYRVGTFVFEVKIVEERSNFNRKDVLITPVSGEGQKWVYFGKLIVAGA